jgi:hypothetical protein
MSAVTAPVVTTANRLLRHKLLVIVIAFLASRWCRSMTICRVTGVRDPFKTDEPVVTNTQVISRARSARV